MRAGQPGRENCGLVIVSRLDGNAVNTPQRRIQSCPAVRIHLKAAKPGRLESPWHPLWNHLDTPFGISMSSCQSWQLPSWAHAPLSSQGRHAGRTHLKVV